MFGCETEVTNFNSIILQMYQAQVQCQRCHRLQLQDHHHHHHNEHHDVQPHHPDCDVIIPPPPEYVDFALPAYDDLFPTLENVHKSEAASPITTPQPSTTTTTTTTNTSQPL